MKKRTVLAVVLTLAAGLIITGCNGDPKPDNEIIVPVTGITGVPGTIIATDPYPLSGVEVEPENATNKTIIWTIVDAGETGAKIENNSLVATGTGWVLVRATIENGAGRNSDWSDNFEVQVLPFFTMTPVTSITGIPSEGFAGTPIPLTSSAIVNPEDATNKAITWTIADAGTTQASLGGATTNRILNVSAPGIVILLATITDGIWPGNDYEDLFEITIKTKPVESITGVPGTGVLGVAITLSGTVNPAEATFKTILWSFAEAGVTGATLTGNIFNSTEGGTYKVRATITNGKALGENYTQDFDIVIEAPKPPNFPIIFENGMFAVEMGIVTLPQLTEGVNTGNTKIEGGKLIITTTSYGTNGNNGNYIFDSQDETFIMDATGYNRLCVLFEESLGGIGYWIGGRLRANAEEGVDDTGIWWGEKQGYSNLYGDGWLRLEFGQQDNETVLNLENFRGFVINPQPESPWVITITKIYLEKD